MYQYVKEVASSSALVAVNMVKMRPQKTFFTYYFDNGHDVYYDEDDAANADAGDADTANCRSAAPMPMLLRASCTLKGLGLAVGVAGAWLPRPVSKAIAF